MRYRVIFGLVAVAVASTSLVGSGSAATAADPVGTVILPAVYGDSVARTDLVAASQNGIGFTVTRGSSTRPSFQYWTPSSGAVDSGISSFTTTMAGNQAAVWTYDSNGNSTYNLVNLVTGAARQVPVGPTTGDTFVETGDGFLIHASAPRAGGYDYLLLMNGSTQFSANMPVTGNVFVGDSRADSKGALVEWWEANGGNGKTKLSYLDFATKHWTKLAEVSEVRAIAMSPSQVGWLTVGVTIHRLSRTALTAAPNVYNAPVGVSSLALNGSSVAWESVGVSGGNRITHVWTKVGSATPVEVNTIAGEPTPLGTDFAVVSGSTASTAGIYRLHPGSSALSTRLVSSGPDAPLSVTESAGRFLYQSPKSKAPVAQRAITATVIGASPKISVAAATALTTTSVIGVPPASSGGHTATYECAATCSVVVRDGTSVLARIPWTDSVTGLGLSGNNLLVSAEHDVLGSDQMYHTEFYSKLYDLNSISTPIVEPYSAAVSGRRIAFASTDGSITVRDLSGSSPVDTVVRTAGMPPATTQVLLAATTVRFMGDWVLWSIPNDSLSSAETVAYHLPDGASHALPNVGEVQLADGQVAYIASTDRSVHLVDLASSTNTVIGKAQLETSNRQWLAMSDEVIAFVAPDDTTHLVPLAGTHGVTVAPTIQGAIASAASSLVRPLRVQIDASRPVSSWTFNVLNSQGKTVFTAKGKAPDGGPRPIWTGLTTAGTRVPDGVYTWHISGAGTGGHLTSGFGPTAHGHGTVRLDTKAPLLTLSAPAHSGHVSIALKWSTTEPATATITVSKRVLVGGRITWTAPKNWLRTSGSTATYSGTHIPFPLAAGEVLRFTVKAVDAAGNASSIKIATTNVA